MKKRSCVLKVCVRPRDRISPRAGSKVMKCRRGIVWKGSLHVSFLGHAEHTLIRA